MLSNFPKLIKKNPQTEVVSMSGDLNRQNMEMAIKSGASRFLAKPLIADEVTLTLEKILAYWQLRKIDSTFKNKKQAFSDTLRVFSEKAKTKHVLLL